MKIYPRLELDISFKDLLGGLFLGLVPLPRKEITSQIQAFWGTERAAIATLSARTSFDLFLQALALPQGSEILMSAVNIVHMAEIVERHHCIPVAIDLDLATLAPSLEILNASISRQSKVFVIAHLFGTITPLEPYLEICQKHDILLVEDCAQAFAGSLYLGHPYAVLSLFSFGPIKSHTALGGGVALIRDRFLAETMQAIEQTYPTKKELWFLMRLFKYLWLKIFSIPEIFGIFIFCVQCLRKDPDLLINSLTRGFTKGDILSQLRYRPPSQMLQLLQNRLNHVDKAYFDRRADRARKFLSLLGDRILSPGSKSTQHSYWLIPILVENPVLLMEAIRAKGFDATRGTTSLIAIGKDSHQAMQLIEHVLYLPIHSSVSESELIYLSQLIQDFWGE
jgi:perosamine synthetase